jgi:hypothetical protein
MSEQTHRLPPLYQTNEVLSGHDGTPGLIAFEIQGDKVTIFSRACDTTRSQTVPFQPFLRFCSPRVTARSAMLPRPAKPRSESISMRSAN